MVLSLIKFFRGFLLVRLWGYAPERFLNLCSNHDILIWNLTYTGEYYEFNISIDGYRRLKPLLVKTRTRLHIKKRYGLPFFLYRYRKRKMFFLGIAGCFALLFFLSGYIWMIDINGNSAITDDLILTYLKENDSGFGEKKSRLNCEQLEEGLRSSFDSIIWASVKLSGTKLTIDIQENLVTAKGSDSVEGELDIAAQKDAKILSIITRSGTPLVKAGDAVKAGDILVTGRLDIIDDAGETINYHYVTSDADIIGQTQYMYEDSFDLKYKKKVPTGKEKDTYSVELFGKKIDFSWKKPDFTSFDMITEQMQLRIGKNYYLPIIVRKNTYKEYESRTSTYTKKEAEEKEKENISLFLKNLEEKGVQIIENNVIIEIGHSKCTAKGTILATEQIGSYVPTEIIEPPVTERQNTDESN